MAKTLGIKNGLLVRSDKVVLGDVLIRAGKIAKIGQGVAEEADVVLSVNRCFVAPGFIDIQVNGALGHDFLNASPDEIDKILDFFARHGTAGLLVTLTTAPFEELHSALLRLAAVKHPAFGGVHLEGPFLAEATRGAHPKEYLRLPSLELVRLLLRDFGKVVKLWTLAPELPGALELVKELADRGIQVAAGHSEASYDEALQAFSGGVSLVTHLFNGMRPFHHRHPGLCGAALDSRVFVSLICDGVHVHPASVRVVAKVKGFSHVILITDAVSPTGLLDGEYPLFGQKILVDSGIPRLTDGTLAGSTLTMERAVKNFMEFTGCSLPEVVRCATLNPARLLGIDDKKGSLAVGKDADLVIFDEDFNVQYTFIGGKIVYARED